MNCNHIIGLATMPDEASLCYTTSSESMKKSVKGWNKFDHCPRCGRQIITQDMVQSAK